MPVPTAPRSVMGVLADGQCRNDQAREHRYHNFLVNLYADGTCIEIFFADIGGDRDGQAL